MTTKAAILHAIRQKCLDCSGGRPGEVRKCTAVACDLWPYRMGGDPEPSPTRGFANFAVSPIGHARTRRAGVSTQIPIDV